MQVSAKTYFKLYFWQFFSIILNFVSLYNVVPKLSSNPTIYGIYSICIGLNMFMAYADIGFISAAQKYASEHFALKNIIDEVKITAFACFILWLFSLIFVFWIIFVSYNPKLIINNLDEKYENVVKYLLWTLALSSQILILQRLVQIIFGIRLKDFVFQRLNIISNLIKILGVFYFFQKNNYNIVGYFLFTQILNLIFLILSMFIAKKKFQYPFVVFYKNFKFSKKQYNISKKLAFSSLLLTISWILYYELDAVTIGKIWGPTQVAYYAVGFSLLSLFRTIFSSIFNPFSARFNHFVGLKDYNNLYELVKKVVYLTFPFVTILIFTILFFSKSIVISWVGVNYNESIFIAQLLVCYNILGFISYPASILLIALEKNKLLVKLSLLMPIIYWGLIYFLKNRLGLPVFPIAKLSIGIISDIVYLYFLFQLLNIEYKKQIFKYAYFFILNLLSVAIISTFVKNFYTINSKNAVSLLYTFFYIIITFTTSYLIYAILILYFNKNIEQAYLKDFIHKLKIKLK